MQFTKQTLITLALGLMTVQLTEGMPTHPYGDATIHYESGSMPTTYKHKNYGKQANGSYGGSNNPHYNEHDQMPHYSGDNTEDCDDEWNGSYGHHDDNDNSGYGAPHHDNHYEGNGNPSYQPSGNDMGAPDNGDNMPPADDTVPSDEMPADEVPPAQEPTLAKRSILGDVFDNLLDNVQRQPTRVVRKMPKLEDQTDDISEAFPEDMPSFPFEIETPLEETSDDFPTSRLPTVSSNGESFNVDELRPALRTLERILRNLTKTQRQQESVPVEEQTPEEAPVEEVSAENNDAPLKKRSMDYSSNDSNEDCENEEEPEHHWGHYSGDMNHEMPSYGSEEPADDCEDNDPEHHWGPYEGDVSHEIPSYGHEEEPVEECEEETPDHHWEYYEGDMDHEMPSYETPSEECEEEDSGDGHYAHWNKEQPAPMNSDYIKGWKKHGNYWQKIVRKVSDKTGETTYYKIIKVIVPWNPHQEDKHMPHYPTEPTNEEECEDNNEHHEEEDTTKHWYPHQGKGHVTKMYKKISKVNQHYTGESNEGSYHITSHANSYGGNDNGQHGEDPECEDGQTDSGEHPSHY